MRIKDNNVHSRRLINIHHHTLIVWRDLSDSKIGHMLLPETFCITYLVNIISKRCHRK
jgi:hypothetical protein